MAVKVKPLFVLLIAVFYCLDSAIGCTDANGSCEFYKDYCHYGNVKQFCPCTCGGGSGSQTSDDNSGSSNSGTEGDFAKILLDEHNKRRRKHGTPSLKYDNTLAKQSKDFCNTLARSNGFYHSNTRGVGENLYYSTSNRNDVPARAVEKWYDEIKDYDFRNPGFSGATGHFTAVVWKATRKVGCGVSDASLNRRTYVCCQYTPQGNMLGAFEENVPPPRY